MTFSLRGAGFAHAGAAGVDTLPGGSGYRELQKYSVERVRAMPLSDLRFWLIIFGARPMMAAWAGATNESHRRAYDQV
jgi:hypothetical protein